MLTTDAIITLQNSVIQPQYNLFDILFNLYEFVHLCNMLRTPFTQNHEGTKRPFSVRSQQRTLPIEITSEAALAGCIQQARPDVLRKQFGGGFGEIIALLLVD